jgi:hypothetical protein
MIERGEYTDPTNVDFAGYNDDHAQWLIANGEEDRDINNTLYQVANLVRDQMTKRGVSLLRHKEKRCILYRPAKKLIGQPRPDWKPVKVSTLESWAAQYNASVAASANIAL